MGVRGGTLDERPDRRREGLGLADPDRPVVGGQTDDARFEGAVERGLARIAGAQVDDLGVGDLHAASLGRRCRPRHVDRVGIVSD